ncbi:hypothetical protein [Corynebacterium hindlerae]|uniref:hypothetical protein n=1 Tax=Corynebacterium hindlerae TaxID=699041 RepID=UPI0031B6DB17
MRAIVIAGALLTCVTIAGCTSTDDSKVTELVAQPPATSSVVTSSTPPAKQGDRAPSNPKSAKLTPNVVLGSTDYAEYWTSSGLKYDKKERTVTVTFNGSSDALVMLDKDPSKAVQLPFTADVTTTDYYINLMAGSIDRSTSLTCSVAYNGKPVLENSWAEDGKISCSVPAELLADIDTGKVTY